MQVTVAHLSEAILNERIDSQFFRPEYVASYEVVSKGTYSSLVDIAHITDGNHLKIAENFDDENGIRYLRGQDLGTDMILNDRNVVHIPESCFNTLKRSHIFKDDILITIVGANTGLVGLVFDPPKKLVANCKLGIARPNRKKVLPGFLYAFLIGRFGQHQILRSIRGGGQTGLILPDMRGLRISRFDRAFESKIDDIVIAGHKGIAASKELFLNTQNILLTELGLTNWQPKHQLTFVKNYSDTEQVGRIDAEYFQPKYEEIEQAIEEYPGGYSTIGAAFKQNKSTFKIDDKKLYQYVEIGSVNVSNGEITPNEVLGEELPANAKRALKKNEIIVSKVRTYRGAITIVEESGYVGSGAFTVLRENGRINKETLLAFLHSNPLLAWSLKPNTGTSYPVIIDNDILNLPIPLIPESKQTEIQQKVTESFSLRKQSKHLLECAKRAVEIAIEKDEKSAIDWLKDQVEV
ncbi:MAG: restriction endonuclease subunit S [Nitrospirae bacterium]|nr:restriction endonuclease subunit S [Nitrospirota bacterium]MDA1305516.1 restriction endonuclease subunit S [Nitrospirota bacterium]